MSSQSLKVDANWLTSLWNNRSVRRKFILWTRKSSSDLSFKRFHPVVEVGALCPDWIQTYFEDS
jgi:hypothetical protein